MTPAINSMTTTRKSPIAHLVADAPAPVQAALHHPVDMVKLGAKGPRLVGWAAQHALALPAQIYDTRPVGADGVLARVGTGELILECRPIDELWARLNAALEAAEAGVYRVEQQSVTLVVRGDAAEGILAQACAVDLARESAERMVYTQVAGAACGVLPRGEDGQCAYRLWVDYSLASLFVGSARRHCRRYHLRQNAGLNSTKSVKTSSRPISMAKHRIHLATELMSP